MAERTSVFNAKNLQITLLSVNMTSVTKLTNENYLMWSRQARAFLEGHELHQFIDSSNDAQSETVMNKVSHTQIQPLLLGVDKIVYCILLSSVRSLSMFNQCHHL